MRTLKFVWAGFLCAMSLLAFEADEATVEVHLTTTFGVEVLSGEVTIRRTDGPFESLTVPAKELRPQKVPYGKYEITFTGGSVGWTTKRQLITVNRERVFVILTIDASPPSDLPDHGNVSISIRTRPAESCSPGGKLIAKLVGTFSDFQQETRISPQGYGLIEPIPIGKYVLVVTDGPIVRALQEADTIAPITVINVPLRACDH
jgi:hypothetical protein